MRFVKLASNWLERVEGDPFVWPFWVDVAGADPDDPDAVNAVAIAEGVAHGSAGGVFSVEEALAPVFARVFEGSNGEWLLPHLERMRAGRRYSEAELAGLFRERHGREPEVYEWDVQPPR